MVLLEGSTWQRIRQRIQCHKLLQVKRAASVMIEYLKHGGCVGLFLALNVEPRRAVREF